jgi:hypothetical protein
MPETTEFWLDRLEELAAALSAPGPLVLPAWHEADTTASPSRPQLSLIKGGLDDG